MKAQLLGLILNVTAFLCLWQFQHYAHKKQGHQQAFYGVLAIITQLQLILLELH